MLLHNYLFSLFDESGGERKMRLCLGNNLRMGNCVVLAWLEARCPPKLLCHSPSQLDRGEQKYNEMFMRRDKDRGRSLSNYCHGQNRLNLGK